MYVCVPHVCLVPTEAKMGFTRTGVTGGCEPPCGHWGLNLGLLEDQTPLNHFLISHVRLNLEFYHNLSRYRVMMTVS